MQVQHRTLAGATITVYSHRRRRSRFHSRRHEVCVHNGTNGRDFEWTANSVTCTGPKDGKLKAIDVNMNAMPDAAMTQQLPPYSLTALQP